MKLPCWQAKSANTPEKNRKLHKARARLSTAGMIQVFCFNFGTAKEQKEQLADGPIAIVLKKPSDGTEVTMMDVVTAIGHSSDLQRTREARANAGMARTRTA